MGTGRRFWRSLTGTKPERVEPQDPCGRGCDRAAEALGQGPGQAADCTAAEALLAEIDAGMTVIADKAYDTNATLDLLTDVGAAPFQEQPHRATDARPRGVCDAQSGPAVLRQNEGVPASRHPI